MHNLKNTRWCQLTPSCQATLLRSCFFLKASWCQLTTSKFGRAFLINYVQLFKKLNLVSQNVHLKHHLEKETIKKLSRPKLLCKKTHVLREVSEVKELFKNELYDHLCFKQENFDI